MFRGVNIINLDEKSRIALPRRYREPVQHLAENKLIVTIDTEARCLLLYPLPEWEKIEARLQALPSFNEAARRIQRLLIGHATETQVDNQGRILLPHPLREYAYLQKQIVLLGQGRKFEIWDEGHWYEQRDHWLADGQQTADALPDELKQLSL